MADSSAEAFVIFKNDRQATIERHGMSKPFVMTRTHLEVNVFCGFFKKIVDIKNTRTHSMLI